MSYESEGRTESQEREVLTLERPGKTYKIGYVVVIEDDEGHICDTPFASFNRGLAEEMALEYAYEQMWREWYYALHGMKNFNHGYVSSIYARKLTDYNVIVKEIKWYE